MVKSVLRGARWLRMGVAVWALVGHPAAAQSLPAEAEIGKLITTYGWAVDAKDIDSMMSIFSRNAVYDLSAYGHASVVGHDAIRAFFLQSVFPSEKCSFSSITNVKIELAGNHATGADYFVHWGYDNPRFAPNTRHHVEGRHFYEFEKEAGAWKISRMLGRPSFEQTAPFDPAGMRHCP